MGRPVQAMRYLTQDWRTGEPLFGRVTVTIFRLGQLARRYRMLGPIWAMCDTVWTRLLMGSEIPSSVEAGVGLHFNHGGRGIILHPEVRLGTNVTIYHNVTLGRSDSGPELAPLIEDDVYIGTGAVVIGGVKVGSRARIGAGAVVTKDVPADATVVGVPAHVVAR